MRCGLRPYAYAGTPSGSFGVIKSAQHKSICHFPTPPIAALCQVVVLGLLLLVCGYMHSINHVRIAFLCWSVSESHNLFPVWVRHWLRLTFPAPPPPHMQGVGGRHMLGGGGGPLTSWRYQTCCQGESYYTRRIIQLGELRALDYPSPSLGISVLGSFHVGLLSQCDWLILDWSSFMRRHFTRRAPRRCGVKFARLL